MKTSQGNVLKTTSNSKPRQSTNSHKIETNEREETGADLRSRLFRLIVEREKERRKHTPNT